MTEISVSDLDIVIQFLILALLIYGYWRYKVKHKFRDHGIIFTVATVVNTVTVLFLMLPQLDSKIKSGFALDLDLLVVLLHSLIGTIAALLAVYIVVRWLRHKKNTKACKGRTLMRVTYFTWLISLLLGMYQYFSG